jgi:hypothetical protein
MADDQEKTEEDIFFNADRTSSIYYAGRYGTKEKFYKNFREFF